MTMTLDPQSRHLGGGMHYDHMPFPGPSFTNPWAGSTSGPSTSQVFPTSLSSGHSAFDSLQRQQAVRGSNVSISHASNPNTASSNFSSGSYSQPELLGMQQPELLSPPRDMYGQGYSTSASPSYAPTSAPYSLGSFAHIPQHSADSGRRLSHTSNSSGSSHHDAYDALDAGRGMVAMSQDLTTPRNIYGRQRQSSADCYGFPSSHSSHSSHSSISGSSSGYGSYYDSVDSSVSGYSSQSEVDSVSSIGSRTLPRPSALIGGAGLPAPQSMMGQFNSKISSSTQKKHKCKVCDKRFTRPSSLQTHMYSHTGEKPYACEVDGCGRHFSVVSNLRRHRKVHKGDHMSDQGSPEGSWVSDK